ncbi:hypothetical protein HDU76_013355 [Blyttiomyces sp. JEL0837]|nr:hypothetical protein HDU76_013355 [Blyttiomyces sp. JEL0837]
MLSFTHLSFLAAASALLAALLIQVQAQYSSSSNYKGVVGRFFYGLIPLEKTLACATLVYQTYDGSCNNLVKTEQGKVNGSYIYVAPANFSRTVFAGPLPDARALSLALQSSNGILKGIVDGLGTTYPSYEENFDDINIKSFFVEFGQFLNHDLELNKNTDPFTQLNLEIPYGDVSRDPLFAPSSAPGGNPFNPANLSVLVAVDSLGPTDAKGNLVSVTNLGNSYIDLSSVYGTDTATNKDLRTLSKGKLLTGNWTSDGGLWSPAFGNVTYTNMLPGAVLTGLMTGVASFPPFTPSQSGVSGDVRAIENIFLATQHTLWMREHNRIASLIAADPSGATLTDEQIFQVARRINIAQYQSVVYNEWLPTLLSGYTGLVPAYKGYNSAVDASTSIDFASAAMRYGHTLVRDMDIVSCNGIAFGTMNTTMLRYAFALPNTNSKRLPYNGGSFNLGLGPAIISHSAKFDLQVSSVLTTIPGTDLAALDIARARRNGVASYNAIRTKFGTGDLYAAVTGNPCKITDAVDPLTCWAKITANATIQATLQNLYKKVANVDPMIGFLAEDRPAGTHISKTLATVMAAEFVRKRDGDRFYVPWVNTTVINSLPVKLSTSLLSTLVPASVKYSDIIKRNAGVTNVPTDVFHVPATPLEPKVCSIVGFNP